MHKQSKHEGIIIDCDQCEHKAKHEGSLRLPKQRKHEFNFNCDLCDFKAATKKAIKYHKQLEH